MKTISVRDLQKKVRQTVDVAQKEPVVVTRHGRPAVLVTGVEGYDWEDLVYQTSPEFWKMIGRRRRGKTIPLEEMRRRLEARWAGRKGHRKRH